MSAAKKRPGKRSRARRRTDRLDARRIQFVNIVKTAVSEGYSAAFDKTCHAAVRLGFPDSLEQVVQMFLARMQMELNESTGCWNATLGKRQKGGAS